MATYFDIAPAKRGVTEAVELEDVVLTQIMSAYQPASGRRDETVIQVLSVCAQAVMFRLQSPYYKVSPSYLEAFSSPSIDKLPIEFLRIPFPCYNILFPIDVTPGGEYISPITGAHGSLHVTGLSVLHSSAFEELPSKPCYQAFDSSLRGIAKNAYANTELEKFDDYVALFAQQSFGSFQQTEHDLDLRGVYHHGVVIPLKPHMTVGQTVKVIDQTHQGRIRESAIQTLRVSLTLAMLAVGHDRIIEPDVLSKDIAKYRDACNSDDEEAVETIVERATRRRNGRKGYMIGHRNEYELLRRMKASGATDNPTANNGGLKFQHLRAGHLHGYHTRNGYAVKWIKPTSVRPDLPPNPEKVRGYRV